MRTARSTFTLFVMILLIAMLAVALPSPLPSPVAALAPATTQSAGWRSGGPFDATMTPIPVANVAASPNYAADGILFAATDQGVYRSTTRGRSWQPVLTPPAAHTFHFTHVAVSPNYAQDGVVFVAFVDDTAGSAGLYKSTDGGLHWSQLTAAGAANALLLSPNFAADKTIFVGRQHAVRKSTDGGVTWTDYPLVPAGESFDLFDLAI